MAKIIVHIDLNAFFATCEELRDPSLSKLPLIIGHSGRSGIVSTANYKAREYGIHSGQPTFQAQKLCPNVKIVEPDYSYYQVMSTSFFCLIKRYCPLIEVASIDECYADFTDVLKGSKDPLGYLRALQRKVKAELGLSCSMGVAPTKWLAKMASDMKKPMGLVTIRRKDIPSIIYPLPIASFWGIGKKTAPVLESKGIKTIGDLKHAFDTNNKEIIDLLGKFALTVEEWVNGKGSDTVHLEYEDPKSIGNSHTLYFDCDSLHEIENDLRHLAKEVSERAKASHKKGYGITLTVKDTAFHLHTKAVKLEESTNSEETIFSKAVDLYTEHFEGKFMIRLVGITLTRLVDPAQETVQMSLWNYDEYAEQDKTKLLISEINRKMGEDVLMRGRQVKEKK